MRVLFICESVTLAHLTRAIVLANQLIKLNFNVILASSYKKKDLQNTFFNIDSRIKILEINTLSSKEFLKSLEFGVWPYSYKILKEYDLEDKKLIEAYQPDLVIGDFRLSLQTTCNSLGVKFLGIVNCYWLESIHNNILTVPAYKTFKYLPLKFAQKLFSLLTPLALKLALNSINKLRKEKKLILYKNFEEYFSFGNDALYPEPPSLFNKNKEQFKGSFIGFTHWSPITKFNTNILDKNRKNIYVSLGSSGDTKIIEKIISVLNELNLNVILTSAKRELKLNPILKFNLFDYLPGEEISKHVDLVITNGGSPATYQAISKNRPVIGIPSNLDQFLCMQALCKYSFVKSVRADRFNLDDFKEKVISLLENKSIIETLKEFNKNLNLDSLEYNFYNIVTKKDLENKKIS